MHGVYADHACALLAAARTRPPARSLVPGRARARLRTTAALPEPCASRWQHPPTAVTKFGSPAAADPTSSACSEGRYKTPGNASELVGWRVESARQTRQTRDLLARTSMTAYGLHMSETAPHMTLSTALSDGMCLWRAAFAAATVSDGVHPRPCASNSQTTSQRPPLRGSAAEPTAHLTTCARAYRIDSPACKRAAGSRACLPLP